MSSNTDTMTRAEELRHALVDRIVEGHERQGLTMRRDVEQALRKVPRELFTPGVSLEEAYEDTAIVTKRRADGVNISSVSAPYLIAEMLNQAHGSHVLELGSGGYNAALLREIVGPEGTVTSVDIDQEVVDRARTCLDAAGYHDVQVICADGEHEVEPGRTYDLIICTVGAWDIPPAWISQLTEGGTLVVPLRTLGMTRSWALQRSGDHLASRSHLLCGFVPMQGVGANEGREIPLGDGVNLWLDEPQSIDAGSLGDVLDLDREESWSGVTIPIGTVCSDLDLWLASRIPDFCLLVAQQSAIDSGLVAPSRRWGTPAFVEGPTLAYRGKPRPIDADRTTFELGVYAHGPEAAQAATGLTEQIRAWDDAGRPAPTLLVFPTGTPDRDLPEGLVLDKRHSRIVITWPSAK